MLQHNATHGDRAHLAHAAMISLHAFCCGMPALAMMLMALSGAASGGSIFVVTTQRLHAALHGQEIWILAASAVLVGIGGLFELAARRGGARRGFPWLFALSLGCFALNFAIIALHRGI